MLLKLVNCIISGAIEIPSCFGKGHSKLQVSKMSFSCECICGEPVSVASYIYIVTYLQDFDLVI